MEKLENGYEVGVVRANNLGMEVYIGWLLLNGQLVASCEAFTESQARTSIMHKYQKIQEVKELH